MLYTVRGSKLLSNTWKQELTITDRAVYAEILRVPKRIQTSLPYDRIAQVNLVRGILTADLEVVNKGGADNLVVRALPKRGAEKAKALIEQRIKTVAPTSTGPTSVADEIRKLAELKERGVLSDAEFQDQKRRLLA